MSVFKKYFEDAEDDRFVEEKLNEAGDPLEGYAKREEPNDPLGRVFVGCGLVLALLLLALALVAYTGVTP